MTTWEPTSESSNDDFVVRPKKIGPWIHAIINSIIDALFGRSGGRDDGDAYGSH